MILVKMQSDLLFINFFFMIIRKVLKEVNVDNILWNVKKKFISQIIEKYEI